MVRAPRFRLFLLGAGALWLVAGCAPPEVTYKLRFPSEETFLMSRNARVEIYPGDGTGDESPDSICRALSIDAAAPRTTLQSSGQRDVCEFEAGLALEDVEVGRLVFAASVQDANGTTILRGCTVADVTADGDEVEIQLSTLPSYPDAPAPACPNVQRKCVDRDCGP